MELAQRCFSNFLFTSFLFLISLSQAGSNPAPAGISSTSAFGVSPIYSPGIKTSMVVDEFGMIDSTLTQQKLDDIKKAITDWHADGIEYGAYYNATNIETDLRFTLSTGAAVDLDGTPKLGVVDVNGTPTEFYQLSWTRQTFKDYLINSGKLAIDLGADHIFIDVASVDFSTYSFDDEVVAAYQTYSGGTNIKTYLTSTKGFADSAALEAALASDSTLGNDATWAAWVAYDKVIERTFFSDWSTALKNYAASKSQSVKLSANRYIDDNDNWVTSEYLDYTIAETFLDTLGYPNINLNFFYKTSVAFGKRFWSWNFPNNTSNLNGGDNQPSNTLDRMFVAQTFANGGLSQVGGSHWVNFSKNVYPQVTIPDYQLVQKHPELFDHAEASEIAVVYSEASIEADSGGLGNAFRGMTHLLSDAHRTWDVVVASNPNRAGYTELLSLSKLQEYSAVVLPQTQYLSDAQVSILEDYLNAGGVVVGTSTVARYDENKVDQSAGRSFDDLFGSDATDTSTYNPGTVISFNANMGQQYYNNPTDATLRATLVSDFEAALSPVVSASVTTDLPASINLSRFEDSADGSHIYHLVNTDYNSGTGNMNTVSAGSTMTLPVPANFSGTVNVDIMTPEAPAPVTLTASGSGNTRSITLPALNTWAILKVGSAASAPQSIDNKPLSQAHFIDSQINTLDDATATGGNRPDAVDGSGNILFGYWFWKNAAFDIAYLASDDGQISSTQMFYRYSSDNASWGSWTSAASQSDNSQIVVNTFNFSPADGDGYYQFYFQATDNNSQLESSSQGDETAFGFDTNPPGMPASFAEKNGIANGVWQSANRNPEFTWPAPVDTLSGVETGWLSLTKVADGSTPADCTINNQASTNSWNLASGTGCDGSNAISDLVDGLYKVSYRSRDNASNTGSTIDDMFSLRIGTASVQAPQNLTLVAGDTEATVYWDAPSDTTNFDEVRVYVTPTSQTSTILGTASSMTISNPVTDNSYTRTGLTNGIEYRVSVEAFNRTTNLPGDLVAMSCTFTPGTTATTDCSAPAVAAGVSLTQSAGATAVTEGGNTDSVDVVLDSQPASDVTFNLSPDTQLGVNVSSLTFTSVNWNVAQTVTVNAVDDSVVEGAHTGSLAFSVSSSDQSYNALSVSSLSVSITDNDVAVPAGITVTQSNGSSAVTEGGATDSYTAVLNSQPDDDVVITLGGLGEQLSTNVSSLTFTPTNWATPQTVTITAVDDAAIEGSQSVSITQTVSSMGDVNYNGLSLAAIAVSITDNDVAGVTLTQTSGSTAVTEGGASDTYTVKLNALPSSSVVITLVVDAAQLTTQVTEMTFTASNWDSPQSVLINAVNDKLNEGDHSSSISHTVSSADTNYDGFSVTPLVVNITDNDNAGVSITQSGGSTTAVEGGAGDSYSVILASQPTSDVTVAFNTDAQLTTGNSTLTFTSSNWNTAQTMIVYAVDDTVVEGDHSANITHSVTSIDANYNGLTVAPVTVSITDNDANAAIFLVQSNNSTAVTEGGAGDSYTLVLASEPFADVTIALTVDAQLSADVSSLTFTSSNWNTPQTVTVNAVNDTAIEGDHSGSISHAVSSSDAKYNGLSVASVTVSITDNDTNVVAAGATLIQSNGSTAVTEGGAGDSYTLVLDSQPSADVTVSLTVNAQLSADVSRLIFTPTNWDTAQTVSVSAVDDTVVEGNHSGSITHTVSSNDANYDGLSVASVTVSITDNDTSVVVTPGATLVQSNGSTAVTEGGAGDGYTLVLSSEPSADVTITLTLDAQLSADVSRLIFTPTNWDTPQAVSVSAVDDTSVEGDHSGSITHAVSSNDTDYDGLSVASLSVAITDNDEASTGGGSTGGSSSGGGLINPLFFLMLIANLLMLRLIKRP